MISFNIGDHADQEFSAVLGTQRVTLRLWYNTYTDRWSLSISIDDEPILVGIRVVPGVDMLDAFNLGIGAIFAFSDTGDDPDRDNLPNGNVKLYHATTDEINATVAT